MGNQSTHGMKVSKGAKIRNRYNQVPHLTQDTNGKVTNSQHTPQTRAKRSALSQQVTTKHIQKAEPEVHLCGEFDFVTPRISEFAPVGNLSSGSEE